MLNEDNQSQQELQAAIDAELAEFASAEARSLGLEQTQYTERVAREFSAAQRDHTTILLGGLTMAQDELIARGLKGIGYIVQPLESPDNLALQYGKEFGNRGQCNPTWYTVGNLVKTLIQLRDNKGMSTEDIIGNYLFVTAGACGPCRFGTYVTEYRKALRDAGFDGFRVMLFQQQGGLKQATGEEVGLQIDQAFLTTIVRAMMAGDVLNIMGYRMRPYEVTPGATDAALTKARTLVGDALEGGSSVVWALTKARRVLGGVELDRTQVKPVVSVIGEFWAMTTEGDGNYHLQRFLEKEGAEVDIQGVTNWILFMIWENRFDTKLRLELREEDDGRKGLKGKDPQKKLMMLVAADKAVRVIFQSYAKAIGLHGYHLPNMDEIANLAAEFYDRSVRGGEGHMEVGKVIHFVEDKVNHMTVSVKPFGCMPSSGVSDGVQSLITSKWPEAIFLPIETTGDGAVNVYSRIQMMLFKARERAREEFTEALGETGLDADTWRTRVNGSRRWSSVFGRPKHKSASVATSLVYAVS